jgi:hypothetical protein
VASAWPKLRVNDVRGYKDRMSFLNSSKESRAKTMAQAQAAKKIVVGGGSGFLGMSLSCSL